MRLINAEIKGYGRLVDSKVNLDSKVIAIVGPNEAGKTTLLKALEFLSAGGVLSPLLRSRTKPPISDDVEIIKVNFNLEDKDRDQLSDIPLQNLPSAITVARHANGKLTLSINPYPVKPKATLERAIEILSHIWSDYDNAYDSVLREDSGFTTLGNDEDRSFANELGDLKEKIAPLIKRQRDNDLEDGEIAKNARELFDAIIDTEKENSLGLGLASLVEWAEIENPDQKLRDLLWELTPRFLLFDESDRTLLSSYIFDQTLVDSPPQALENLSRMSGLDLKKLYLNVNPLDISRMESDINEANEHLKLLFSTAWKQSYLSVRLKIDGEFLRILILENGKKITTFDERSAGLRMFIALIAFLAARDSRVPPILLIDEAENHLHLDAQADLVNMFMTQEKAARVIYSTHSPACLPPDLGVGIRAVAPRKGEEQASDIQNSFWNSGAGFSPLMIAMGAGAAAFTLGRFVVLGEGATEMILLPSLLRSATGLENLNFQVAPGLSSVPKEFYPSLDFEGAKVAYFLDGDNGGNDLRRALLEKGVPEKQIVQSTAPGLENVLPAEVYVNTVIAILKESGAKINEADYPTLTEPRAASWAKQVSKWCTEKGLKMPSNVAIASRIIDESRAICSPDFREELIILHDQLMNALGRE